MKKIRKYFRESHPFPFWIGLIIGAAFVAANASLGVEPNPPWGTIGQEDLLVYLMWFVGIGFGVRCAFRIEDAAFMWAGLWSAVSLGMYLVHATHSSAASFGIYFPAQDVSLVAPAATASLAIMFFVGGALKLLAVMFQATHEEQRPELPQNELQRTVQRQAAEPNTNEAWPPFLRSYP